MNNLLTGLAMGAALTTAGVSSPDVILSQFTFQDFTMLQTFLAAAASSTLLVTTTQSLGLTTLPPRPPSSLGLLPTRYDGNILGGALLGAGMAVSGACPGTVLAQLGAGGVRSGRWALAGAVLGGTAWSWISRRWRTTTTTTTTGGGGGGGGDGWGQQQVHQRAGENGKAKKAPAAYEALGIGRAAMLVALEAGFVLALAATVKFADAPAAEARGIPPYVAGLAIGGAQLVSMALRGSLLGASAAFEELGGWLWDASARKYAGLLFSVGVVGGAWLASSAVPALRPVADMAVSPARAVMGGFMIIFGSRMAGGCTSGHGISGLSLMSTSSFLTAAAIFAGGGLTGMLLA
ncbi:uncharacterized protein B0T15DRAFT_183351 [Chaetomium strumarium]|uniref:Sulphur transport domain-containing protein n=1 Tax=Chaetomium strumarium TaxID=1170767 RepID=A0AAJ0GWS8_9PEZI|nr:hypothetical protein B0T15DRAFT_183351 [Chaetomium strumarium]